MSQTVIVDGLQLLLSNPIHLGVGNYWSFQYPKGMIPKDVRKREDDEAVSKRHILYTLPKSPKIYLIRNRKEYAIYFL